MLLFGRWVQDALSRKSQDSIAETSARGGETLNAVPTVQAFTQEKYEQREFAVTVERAFAYARSRTLARAMLTAVAIFTASASLATIALVGLHDIVAGQISGGMLVQVHHLWLSGGGRRGRLVGNLGRSAACRRRVGTADGIAAREARHRAARSSRGAARSAQGQREFRACHLPLSHPARRRGAA